MVSHLPFHLPRLDLLTSSAGPRPGPCAQAWHAADLPVAAAQAGPQHRLHVLVLGGVLRMIETLGLLVLQAAARGAVVTAGTLPATLNRRDGNRKNSVII